eukprot:TRINITY_DN16535_c0_g1_i4.p1 TRINITY_DN16535_c0_g1~~TRINITY_DN16535_c0_g1_i4.p1  ORF type:complete len:178 (+),score=20.26 TRINITY_DN16535_c0_g1_i4:76-609(+)
MLGTSLATIFSTFLFVTPALTNGDQDKENQKISGMQEEYEDYLEEHYSYQQNQFEMDDYGTIIAEVNPYSNFQYSQNSTEQNPFHSESQNNNNEKDKKTQLSCSAVLQQAKTQKTTSSDEIVAFDFGEDLDVFCDQEQIKCYFWEMKLRFFCRRRFIRISAPIDDLKAALVTISEDM